MDNDDEGLPDLIAISDNESSDDEDESSDDEDGRLSSKGGTGGNNDSDRSGGITTTQQQAAIITNVIDYHVATATATAGGCGHTAHPCPALTLNEEALATLLPELAALPIPAHDELRLSEAEIVQTYYQNEVYRSIAAGGIPTNMNVADERHHLESIPITAWFPLDKHGQLVGCGCGTACIHNLAFYQPSFLAKTFQYIFSWSVGFGFVRGQVCLFSRKKTASRA